MNITLTLTLEDANTILTALAQGPYNKVATLIEKVESQAKSQLENVINNSQSEPEVFEAELA